MKFKGSERLEREFNYDVDPVLRGVAIDANIYMMNKYGIAMVITCIERSVQENVEVGGVPNSSHITEVGFYCRAIDFRTIDLLTRAQVDDFIAYIKHVHGQRIHVIFHKNHIHMNVNKRYRTAKYVSNAN